LYFNEEHKKEGQKKSKIISYDHEFSDTLETGIHYLNTHGFNIVSTASTQDYYLVMCDNWGDKFEVLK
jgi:hypothetical protein